ncbi:MAG: TIGR03936 family radical SAM-associated protein [Aureliella sp.]
MSKQRVRIHFTKTGDLRWISHRDLARVWERLLRRAGLELAFSEGFHPKPKISFPSALALGIVALDEIVEMDLIGPVDLALARQKIAEQMPEGMQLLSLSEMPAGAGKALIVAASYEIQLTPEQAETAGRRLAEHLQAGKVSVERDGKTLTAAFDQPHFHIDCKGDVLRFTLPTTAQGSLRPGELLEALGIAHVLPDGAVLTRTSVQLSPQRSGPTAGGQPDSAATAAGQ